MKYRALGTALAAATFALVPVGGATAAATSVEDPLGDIAGGVDLLRVTTTHAKKVTVILEHRNLRPSYKSGAGGQIFFDTDPAKAGPEFILSAGLYQGTDYSLNRAKGWKPVGETLTCNYRMTLDYAAETTKVVVGRGCLGKPEEVRIAVKVGVDKKNVSEVDWLTGKRVFGDWVAKG